jgi:hypothetical protein
MLAKNIFHIIDDGFVISDNSNMNKLNDFNNIENQVKDTVRLSNETYKISSCQISNRNHAYVWYTSKCHNISVFL